MLTNYQGIATAIKYKLKSGSSLKFIPVKWCQLLRTAHASFDRNEKTVYKHLSLVISSLFSFSYLYHIPESLNLFV